MRAYFQRLYHFDHWATDQVLASLASCPAPPAQAVSLLSHYLQEQWFALDLLHGRDAMKWRGATEFALADCIVHSAKLDSEWRDYLANKTDGHFETSFEYTNFVGKQTTRVVSDLLTDIVDHGTYHRGQIGTLVRAAGGEPAKTWFTRWVKETNRGTA